MSELQSKTIQWLRFALVVCVLFIHVHPDSNMAYLGMNNLASGSLAQQIYTIVVSALFVVANVAVPLFFFISGLLFFAGCEEQWSWRWWGNKLKRRIYTLLIPYILFNLIGLINNSLVGVLGAGYSVAWSNPERLPVVGAFWNSTTFCVGMENIFGISMQLVYPEVIPLWFVRDLMVTVLLSPVIYKLMTITRGWFVAIVALLYICGVGATTAGINSGAILFFWLGAWFSIRRRDAVEFSSKHKGTILAVATLLLVVSTLYYVAPFAQQLHNAFYIVGVFVALIVGTCATRRKSRKWYDLAVRSSFFIFAVHMLPLGKMDILSWCGALASKLFPYDTIWGAALGYIFAIVLIVVVCEVLYLLLERLTPRLHKLLCGGR